MLLRLAAVLLFEGARLGAVGPLGHTALPLGLGAISFWWMAVWMPVGVPVAQIILKGVAWKEAASGKEK